MISSVGSVNSVNYQPPGNQVILLASSSRSASRSNSENCESRCSVEPSHTPSRNSLHSAQSTESLASMVLTTPTPANSGDSGHSSQISGDGGAAASTVNNQSSYQPRLHPKKRKFNPADLESMDIAINDHKITVYDKSINDDKKNGPIPDGNHTIGTSANDASDKRDISTGHLNSNTVVIKEENGGSHSTAIVHSSFSQNNQYDGLNSRNTPDKVYNYSKYSRLSSRDENLVSAQLAKPTTTAVREYNSSNAVVAPPPSLPPPSSTDDIDLSEWCGHRVLAKHQDVFVAGSIRSIGAHNSVLVELDHPEGSRQMYYDILGNGRFDVVSDASPSVNDVSYSFTRHIFVYDPHFNLFFLHTIIFFLHTITFFLFCIRSTFLLFCIRSTF